MSRLWIITGDRDVGKTRHALIQANHRPFFWMEMKDFEEEMLGNIHARAASLLILDECHTEEHLRTIMEIWRNRWIKIVSPERGIQMRTPELIAIFQTENISSEWLDKFRRLGAYITDIKKREVPYV